jgi:hypothetical protein
MLPTKTELAERYTTFPDRKLLEIIHAKEGFRPEAIEAAREELKKRQVSEDVVQDFIQIKEGEKIIAAENAVIPLPFHQKLLFFFLWFIPTFFGTAFRLNFQEDGMIKKVNQSKWYSIAGLVSLFATVFIAISFDFGNISTFGMLGLFFVAFYIAEGRMSR